MVSLIKTLSMLTLIVWVTCQSSALSKPVYITERLPSLPNASMISSSNLVQRSNANDMIEREPSTPLLQPKKDQVVLVTVSCGNQMYRFMAANMLRGLLMFADYDHQYTFILFTDNKVEWDPLFQKITQEFINEERILDITVKLVNIPDTKDNNMTDQFKKCAGFRVTPEFTQALLDMGYPRAIYGDVDIMILDNIAKLWRHFDSMERMALGLISVATANKGGSYMARIKDKSFSKDDIMGLYGVNSGVVLWNAVMVVEQNFSAAVRDIMNTITDLRWFDQDILNAACSRKQYKVQCFLLPCRWNFRNDKMDCDCLSERQHGIGIYHGNYGKIPGLNRFPKRFELASLWNSTFPCNNRKQCLRHLQTALLSIVTNPENEFYCRSPNEMLLGLYNGTEFQFGAESGRMRCNDERDTYCRILFRVQEMITKYDAS